MEGARLGGEERLAVYWLGGGRLAPIHPRLLSPLPNPDYEAGLPWGPVDMLIRSQAGAEGAR